MQDLSAMTVGNVLLRNALNYPDKEALIFEGHRFTYRQINQRVNRLANALLDLGIGKGDKVGLLFQNCNQFVESYFAASKIGAVAVSLNWRLSANELSTLIGFSDSKVLIYSDMFSEIVDSISDHLPQVQKYIIDGKEPVGQSLLYEDLMAEYIDDEPQIEVKSGDGCEMLFTGGTTGMPKGVWRTHEAVIWSSTMAGMGLNMSADDRVLLTAPLFHVAALDDALVGAFNQGATIFMLRGFDPTQCLEAIQKERLTFSFFVPLMFLFIHATAVSGEYDLGSMRMWGSAAAPMPVDLRNQIMIDFPEITMFEVFGQTENPWIAVLPSHSKAGRPESCGRPAPYNIIRVLDENGREVPAGTIGEVVVNGPAVMTGYYKNQEAADEALRNGWLFTGDMGRLDDEGYLYLVDRKKDMIISGGENVYAAEVENVLIKHPAIAEAAVVGLPDQVWGEIVTAAVVLAPGQTVGEEEIVEFAKNDLASYKCPKKVVFLNELPKSTLMKVLKRQIREELIAGVQE